MSAEALGETLTVMEVGGIEAVPQEAALATYREAVGVQPENLRTLPRPNMVKRPDGFQLTFASVE